MAKKPMPQKQRFALSQAATAKAAKKRAAKKANHDGALPGQRPLFPEPADIPIRAVNMGTTGPVETPLPGADGVRIVLDNKAVVEITPGKNGSFTVRRIDGRRVAVWPEASNMVTVTVEGPLD